MKLTLIVIAAVIGSVLLLIAVIAAIGAFLPRHHEATRSLLLKASPAEVYRVIRDVERAPEWRPDLDRVELLPPSNGRAQFREYADHGVVTYEVVEEQVERALVTQIVDRDLGYSGSWTYLFEPREGGTQLTITERGEVSNVIFRFFSRFIFGHTKTIDTYLASLQKHLSS